MAMGSGKSRQPNTRTQFDYAREGIVTDAMEHVAARERLQGEEIRREVAEGRLVIPANRNHTNLEPIGIGRKVTVKINANIGSSPISSSLEEELAKLRTSIKYGADTVMDLSTGGDLNAIREALLRESTVPLGTVPIYQIVKEKGTLEFNEEDILETLRLQAEQGVDFFTIHCGILRKHLPLVKSRIAGIVSRGGSLIGQWMNHHQKENPFYTMFDQICEIAREHDVTLSLGDGLRPGCLADATDPAQLAELRTLGELTEQAWAKGVQVMIEGPGHVPFDQIQMNVELEQKYCKGAPFYVLGPIVTDVAPGYDHITSAIGATMAAYAGASYLCYVTPREHLGLPDEEDVRQGIIAYKIAAHAADIAKGIPGARDRDDEISRARANFNWAKHFALSLDPERACSLRHPELDIDEDFCTMCGRDFCAMRISRKLKEDTPS